jgi:hypothetical protein
MEHRIDPEGRRLPIKLDSTSNGEFAPVPLRRANLAANRLAHEFASSFSKKINLTRRSFLVSSCGAASTLLAFNAANAAAGRTGGVFEISKDAALDEQLARVQVGPAKDEFIFDVQGHFIDTPKGNAKSAEVFLKDVFMDSDTDVMVLSFVPSRRDAEPVTIQAADAVRRVVEKLEGTHRLLLHGRVNPNQPGDLEGMDELKEKWGVSAWKTYTQWGPDGKGDGPRDRQAGQALRPRQRPVGHRLHLVRLASGPDPDLPRLPDRPALARAARLRRDHP